MNSGNFAADLVKQSNHRIVRLRLTKNGEVFAKVHRYAPEALERCA